MDLLILLILIEKKEVVHVKNTGRCKDMLVPNLLK